MGVKVAALPISAFLALILAVVVIGVTAYARRHGHLQSRGALIAIMVLVGALIVYGMGIGLLPSGAPPVADQRSG